MSALNDMYLRVIKTKDFSGKAYIHIPANVRHNFALKARQKVNIGIGSYLQPYVVVPDNKLPSNTVRIVSEKIRFLPEKRYCFHWDQITRTLSIGPLIAILTTRAKRNKSLPFAGRAGFLQEIINYGHNHGALVYCVTPEGFNYSQRITRGYTQILPGKWIGKQYPLPDVVYNRVPARSSELREKFQITKAYLKKFKIPFFNPHFLNKSHIDRMMRSTSLAKYIPQTERLYDISQVRKYINKYSTVYLKPVHSFAGKGIMRISQQGNNYVAQCREDINNKPRFFTTFNQLYSFLKRRIAKPYLIQQGISLAKYQNNPFDVRVLVQRNGAGQWILIGMGCRVAGPGRITTHVPNGGRIAPIDEVLDYCFKHRAEYIKNDITKLVLRVPPVLEHFYGYSFGIISMDIGVDKHGRLWFFEANSKPMEFDEKDTQERSLENLLAYSKYLAWMQKGESSSNYGRIFT